MFELSDEILKKVIQPRKLNSHKGDYGKLLLIGGNIQYGGAIVLCANAAVHTGAGLVSVATHQKNHSPLHARTPEAMAIDFYDVEKLIKGIRQSDIVVIGCGLGLEEKSLEILQLTLQTVKENQWLIIDGSAITLFAEHHLRLVFPHKTIFTPHEMEWQRLSGIVINAQAIERSQLAVNQLGAVVIAKSHQTKIFYPNDAGYFLTIGTPAQATGGMGDTLAGMIAGILGQFSEDWKESLACAVYLHSFVAQELAKEDYVVLPSRLVQEIPKTMRKFSGMKR